MNNTTNNTNQTKKFNLVKYVYGQLYRGYLESGKSKEYTVTNLKAQTWTYVLKKLQSEKKIENFEIGNTYETAFDVKVKGFEEKDMWYKPYLNAIKKSVESEVA